MIKITVRYYQLELILYDVSANLRFLIKNKKHPYFKIGILKFLWTLISYRLFLKRKVVD